MAGPPPASVQRRTFAAIEIRSERRKISGGGGLTFCHAGRLHKALVNQRSNPAFRGAGPKFLQARIGFLKVIEQTGAPHQIVFSLQSRSKDITILEAHFIGEGQQSPFCKFDRVPISIDTIECKCDYDQNYPSLRNS
jgi:hypothetical protein